MGYSILNPKTGKELFLHKKKGKGDSDLYYFAYEIVDAVELPENLEVKLSSKSGHPYAIKKETVYVQPSGVDNW